jgi:hypothetical protein
VAAGVGVCHTRDPAPPRPTDEVTPLAVSADGPTFGALDELALASDRAIVVVVTAIGPGRSIADPTDPDAGITTQLATAEVELVLLGRSPRGTVVIEQEATLLDGTPIVVNGLAPLRAGDRGVAFLVAGGSEEFPYLALVNEQAWFALDGDRISSERDDPVHTAWDGRPLEALVAATADV